MKKIIAVLLIIGLLPASFIASASDYENHWAREQIDYLIGVGIVSGDAGGIRPEDYIKRAEFVKIINRSFNFNTPAEPGFKDISETDWYYNEMLCAKSAGYLVGDEEGNCNPLGLLTRAEAATIYYRLLKPQVKYPKSFSDHVDIPSWALEAVNSLSSIGILSGYEDGSFKAGNPLKRAEAFYTLVKSQQYSGDIAIEDESVKKEDYVAPNANTGSGGGGGGGGGFASGGSGGSSSGSSVVEVTSLSNNIASWKKVTDAVSYTVTVTRVTEGKAEASAPSVTVSGLSYDFSADVASLMSGGDAVIEETFEITVTANLSSGSSISDTVEKTVNNSHPNTPAVSDISWQLDGLTEKYNITWSSVPSETYHIAADSYKIKISKPDGTEISSEVVSTAVYSYTPDSTVISEGIESVNVEIIACAAGYLDSPAVSESMDILFKGGDGSEASPYLIAAKRHFDNIAKYPAKNYRVVSDIAGTVTDSIESFTGSLMGWDEDTGKPVQRKINIELTDDDIKTPAIGTRLGLFNSVGGSIAYLTLSGSVTCTTRSIYGAALAGHMTADGEISYIINEANVTANASSCQFGGIVGTCYGNSISYCVNKASVAAAHYAGGIIGNLYTDAPVKYLYNTGAISGNYAGGIVCEARYSFNISDCFNLGVLNGATGSGGIGGAFHASATPADTVINNCYTTTGSVLVPQAAPSASITNSYVLGDGGSDKILTSKDALAASGWNFENVWIIDKLNTGYEYPQFISLPYIADEHTLKTPGLSAYFDGEKITFTVTDYDAKAVKYIIGITKDGTTDTKTFETESAEKVVTAEDNIIDISDTDNVKYNITVQAIGNGGYADNIKNSAVGTAEYYHNKPAVATPVISDSATYETKEKYTFSWEAADKADGYKIAFTTGAAVPAESDYTDVGTATSYQYTLPDTFAGDKINVYVIGYTENSLYRDSDAAAKTISVVYAGGTGTEEEPYLVETARHWNNISINAAGGKYFRIISDIDAVTEPIASFKGSITGWDLSENKAVQRNITLSLTNSDNTNYGLINTVDSNTYIGYLSISGAVAFSGNVTQTGGFVGQIPSGKTNITLESLTNNISEINTANSLYLGGIVGYNYSSALIKGCVNNAKLTSTRSSSQAGGIAGMSVGTVEACLNTGDIRGKTYAGGIIAWVGGSCDVSKSANYGSVTADNYASGLIALVRLNASVTDCFNAGELTASNVASAIALADRRTTASNSMNITRFYDAEGYSYTPFRENQTAAAVFNINEAYTTANSADITVLSEKETLMANGWNFDSVWSYDENNQTYAYPQLKALPFIQ